MIGDRESFSVTPRYTTLPLPVNREFDRRSQNVTTASGWGQRLEQCLLLYQARHGRTSLERWGELIANAEGREKPYTKAAASMWIAEKSEPSLRTFEAIAYVVQCDPWWLAWGVGRPPSNVALDLFTPEPRGRGAKKKGGGKR